MPKRTDIATILIIGAGPIVIGQACEFDYSGTQACKALREEGYRIVLVNSNPATIMTDPDMADRTYIEPITPEIVAKIIEKERYADPGGFALLPTMGGQTALNCALSLEENRRAGGIRRRDDRRHCARHRQGRGPRAVSRGDDQDRARHAALASHQDADARRSPRWTTSACPRSSAPPSRWAAPAAASPITRPNSSTLSKRGIDASPTNEVLIEESVLGWKEYEMEVVRDKADNCIIVCSIENIDPMGVHTGDSASLSLRR